MSGNVVQLRHHDLREGDVVRLKSGGPNMLVSIADGEIMPQVQCLWFGGALPRGRRRLQCEMFHAATLEIVARQP